MPIDIDSEPRSRTMAPLRSYLLKRILEPEELVSSPFWNAAAIEGNTMGEQDGFANCSGFWINN